MPARNLRQFVEVLLEREDKTTASEILNNYSSCLAAKEADSRRKTALGISQVADLYARVGGQPLGQAVHKLSEQLIVEKDPELQSLLSAAFVRLSQEASAARNYAAVNEVCAGMELITVRRPVLIAELRPRVGVENRLPEYIEEALQMDPIPDDLLAVLRRTSQAGAEHLADRFFRCMRRDECERMMELVRGRGISDPAAIARNSAHGSAPAGFRVCRADEPLRRGDPARVAAGAHARVESVLSRHGASARLPTAPPPIAGAPCWNSPRFLTP